MKKIKYALGVFFLLLISCKEVVKEKQEIKKETEKYKNPKDEIIVFDTLKDITIQYKDSITNWKGYYRVKDVLESLKTTTPNEVLSNADDLVKDIKSMKDSMVVVSLRTQGMRARINGLYNQALRLQDMSNIPAITVKEVTKETRGLFKLFGMINKKINAIYNQVDFEKEMKADDFFFSKIDSIQ